MTVLGATSFLIATSWLAAGVFVVRLGITTWMRRTAGVLTMSFLLTSFGVMSLALITALAGTDWPGRAWVRLAVYGACNGLLWTSVYLLLRDQRGARRRGRV